MNHRWKQVLVLTALVLDFSCALTSGNNDIENAKALKLLDELLRNYDRRSTPTNNLEMATNVSLELYVASLGSINTENMDYVTDTYLRQKWWDPRLSHPELKSPMDLADPNLVKAIWKPEVFFPNAKEANFQFVTVPNVLIRIHPNGEILYILRLRLKFSCMMELSRYPLDRQICGMQIASFSKTTRELQLFWSDSHEPVSIATDLKMPQFTVEKVAPTTCNEQFHLGNYSCLVAQFHMRRSVSFHLIQSYLPSILIVAVSWVSFWMDIDSVPGRISLGVITLLAVSSQAGLDKNVPQTSYVKAIDVWMGLCTAFVFAALVEFTIVNFWFRKQGGGGVRRMVSPCLCYPSQIHSTHDSSVCVENGRHHKKVMDFDSESCCPCGQVRADSRNVQTAPNAPTHSTSFTSFPPTCPHHATQNSTVVLGQNGRTTTIQSPDTPGGNLFVAHNPFLQDALYFQGDRRTSRLLIGQGALVGSHPAERVDQACRYLFPLGFFACNIIYWLYYLNTSDEAPSGAF